MQRYGTISIAAILLAAGACASGDEGADTAASAAPAVNTVAVTARDFTFEAPDTIPAGWTRFQLANAGMDFHHIVAVRLDSGRTVGELLKALGPGEPPAWAHVVGGPIAPSPGSSGSTSTLIDLAPGKYALICVVPAADGMPHVAKGMVRELTVTPTETPVATAMPSTITMTLSDYAFNTDAPLTAGKHTIRVVNSAAQPHEVVFVRLAPGKTAQEMLAFAEKPQGEPPGEVIGGASFVMGQVENLVELDLTPGEYALICFHPDAKDGKPHFVHGMVQQVTVN